MIARCVARLMAPHFIVSDGGIFVGLGSMPRLRHLRPDKRERALDENDYNHEHMDFAIHDTPLERFQFNRRLADVVADTWAFALKRDYPEWPARLVVVNELTELRSNEGEERLLGVEVYPTIRLWTRQPGEEVLLGMFTENGECATDRFGYYDDRECRTSWHSTGEVLDGTDFRVPDSVGR